jgi:hypothetical protein
MLRGDKVSIFVPAPLIRRKTSKSIPARDMVTFINSNDRLQHFQKGVRTAAWRKSGADAAKRVLRGRSFEQRMFCEATVHLVRNATYDAMNYYPSAKAAIDGIIGDQKMLPNDSNEWLIGPLCIEGEKWPNKPGIEFTFYPLEGTRIYPS